MKQWLANTQYRLWLAVVGTATLVLGAAYTMVQQSTRLSADDTPLAMAQTIKHELESGSAPGDVLPAIQVDLRNDISPFVIVTDNTPHVVASSATLDGKTPLPPMGTFDFTKAHGTDHFTWEPANKVRMATRMLTYKDGYIITGQSLQQAEKRVDTYNALALAAWVAMVAWATLTLLLPARSRRI